MSTIGMQPMKMIIAPTMPTKMSCNKTSHVNIQFGKRETHVFIPRALLSIPLHNNYGLSRYYFYFCVYAGGEGLCYCCMLTVVHQTTS